MLPLFPAAAPCKGELPMKKDPLSKVQTLSSRIVWKQSSRPRYAISVCISEEVYACQRISSHKHCERTKFAKNGWRCGVAADMCCSSKPGISDASRFVIPRKNITSSVPVIHNAPVSIEPIKEPKLKYLALTKDSQCRRCVRDSPLLATLGMERPAPKTIITETSFCTRPVGTAETYTSFGIISEYLVSLVLSTIGGDK